ncbi:hypothetical protein O6H91_03G058500 [Diphasiastrum complanatum]|uniref:Uncharacterized protein n=1 Tax=Diphasiastrum complanatum TaxID=34168 RepID=A0ACC2E6J5_DIPCM|nr:hypothetical protein O6H91_Y138900 [Diphasiastrum complanatum]KAJ7562198.1 hypothetical protein O6H91_03G058500 [Diphasiastrum complanatum]
MLVFVCFVCEFKMVQGGSTEAILREEKTEERIDGEVTGKLRENRSSSLQATDKDDKEICSRSRSDQPSDALVQVSQLRGGSETDQERRNLSPECSANIQYHDSDRSSTVETIIPARIDLRSAAESMRESHSDSFLLKLRVRDSTNFCQSTNAAQADGSDCNASDDEFGIYDMQTKVTITSHDELEPVMEDLGWKAQPAPQDDARHFYSYFQEGNADPICKTSLPAQFSVAENLEKLIWFLTDVSRTPADPKQKRLVFWTKKFGPITYSSNCKQANEVCKACSSK